MIFFSLSYLVPSSFVFRGRLCAQRSFENEFVHAGARGTIMFIYVEAEESGCFYENINVEGSRCSSLARVVTK